MQEKLRSYFSQYLNRDSIFVNKKYLTHTYIPNEILHRDEQISTIARILAPALKLQQPSNLFVYGTTGTGKSLVIKYIFKELTAMNSKNLKTIYINCWDYRTSYSTLAKIANCLGMVVPRRGWSKDEILERIIEWMRKRGKSLVICFDEVDQLEMDALYDWLRIEQYVENPVGLVLVSNYKEILANLEPRIKSSLNVDEIEFKPYSLREIL